MNRGRIFAIGALLVIVPFLMTRQRDDVKAANRIAAAYRKAEARMMEPGATPDDAERLAIALKAIDLSGAPREIVAARSKLVATVENANRAKRNGESTDALFLAVTQARYDFTVAVDQWRGQPY